MAGKLAATLCLYAIAAVLIWLIVRIARSSRRWGKWLGAPILGLVTLVILFLAISATRGMTSSYSKRGGPVPTLTVERTPERIARGEHIAGALCAGCHALNDTLPLSGGRNL